MKLTKFKKGAINIQGAIYSLISVIIGYIIILEVLGSTNGQMQASATNISTSTLPLASLFGGTGVLFLVFMAAIFIGMLVMAFKSFKMK